MELVARTRPDPARERCPYCRDELEGAGDDLVTCQGCGTSHHAACLEELGRCTILGCGRSRPPPPTGADPVGGGSPRVTAARARIRMRVQRFAREHVRDLSREEQIDHREARLRALRESWETEGVFTWELPPGFLLALGTAVLVIGFLSLLLAALLGGGGPPAPPVGGG